jgi:hypothetical protein
MPELQTDAARTWENANARYWQIIHMAEQREVDSLIGEAEPFDSDERETLTEHLYAMAAICSSTWPEYRRQLETKIEECRLAAIPRWQRWRSAVARRVISIASRWQA